MQFGIGLQFPSLSHVLSYSSPPLRNIKPSLQEKVSTDSETSFSSPNTSSWLFTSWLPFVNGIGSLQTVKFVIFK